jgi:formamidase
MPHPLTGPVYVEGAEPGDVLAVEIVELESASFGSTCIVPGFGFLADVFMESFLVTWRIEGGIARSADLPGVAIPGDMFPGVMGVSPSLELIEETRRREDELRARGGAVADDAPEAAIPALAAGGLRTIPPRETGGNMDIKQTCAGSRLFMPVWTEGALFSAGDAHFAQGDCEVCGTAIEMDATFRVRFDLRKGVAAERGIRDLQFERDGYVVSPEFQAPRRFFATTGISVDQDGNNHSESLTVAARNALMNMIGHLADEYGFTPQQAYAICSVAVDLKVSQMADVPNFLVSAVLPLDVLSGS